MLHIHQEEALRRHLIQVIEVQVHYYLQVVYHHYLIPHIEEVLKNHILFVTPFEQGVVHYLKQSTFHKVGQWQHA